MPIRHTPSSRGPARLVRRVLLALTLGGTLALIAPAVPASAGGDCVYAYPQPNLGATVCTPWGG